MLNIIYSEFLKLKRSYMIPIIILGIVFVPVLLFIFQMDSEYTLRAIMNVIPNINIFQIQIVNIFVISIIASYIFSREFTDKTADVLYSYPFSRMKIYIGKVITTYLLVLILYILNFVMTNILVFLFGGMEGVKAVFMIQLKTSILSAVAQIVVLPIPIYISCISKNILFSIVYAVIGAISSMVVMIFGVYMQLSPLMIPSIPAFYFYAKEPIDTFAVSVNIVGTFLIFSTLTILHLKNTDID